MIELRDQTGKTAAPGAYSTQSMPSMPEREVFAEIAATIPKDRDSQVERIRTIQTTRRSAVKATRRSNRSTPWRDCRGS